MLWPTQYRKFNKHKNHMKIEGQLNRSDRKHPLMDSRRRECSINAPSADYECMLYIM